MRTSVGEIVPGISLAAPLADADAVLAQLTSEVDVSDELIATAHGVAPTPRLTGWYGDPEASYTYSGITRVPKPWTPTLLSIRDRLNTQLAVALNSCLVGVYEGGENGVDWHSDDEPELRDRIVSVSLGTQRTFFLRANPNAPALPVPLAHGSVLVMTVDSQRHWQHAILPEPVAGRRINLTFRVIAQA